MLFLNYSVTLKFKFLHSNTQNRSCNNTEISYKLFNETTNNLQNFSKKFYLPKNKNGVILSKEILLTTVSFMSFVLFCCTVFTDSQGRRLLLTSLTDIFADRIFFVVNTHTTVLTFTATVIFWPDFRLLYHQVYCSADSTGSKYQIGK